MDLRNLLVSSLLIGSSAFGIENNIIESHESSIITLAGHLGGTAIYAVQADDDNRAEILLTASSVIGQNNDHWLLLDWDGADYIVKKRGELQPNNQAYLSSYQVSYSEVLLGQGGGKFTRMSFTNDVSSNDHIITEDSQFLSELNHDLGDLDVNFDIKSIVSLQDTDETDHLILCTTEYIHVLSGNELTASYSPAGYCQSGNVDYETLASNPATYDMELITEDGAYLNFDGINWIEKTTLSSADFGDNFKIANIDDDDAEEILSQRSEQVQSFSPASLGSWVYISALQNARSQFNVIDVDQNGIFEVIFDYINADFDPPVPFLNLVQWDDTNDTHSLTAALSSPFSKLTKAQLLPTDLSGGIASNYVVFASNDDTANPGADLLLQLNPSNLSQQWSGLTSTATRSFDTLVKTNVNNTIADYKIAQIEQGTLADDSVAFSLKYLKGDSLEFDSQLTPDFTDDLILTVDALNAFDFSGNGIDELHFGGQADAADPAGLVLSSNLDGSDYSRLDTPLIDKVTSIFTGNVNNLASPDMMATGPAADGNGIGLHSWLDSASESYFWFAPGSGDDNFNDLIAANIKGTAEPEILGLHSQLASIDLNAGLFDSRIYNLSNLFFEQFTTVELADRDYDYALASDSGGVLYFIEPKDFDILATSDACDGSITAIHSIEADYNAHLILAVCNQELLSWVLEYDSATIDHGYSLYPLAANALGNPDTNESKLAHITTDDDTTHLFTLFKNQFNRYTIDKTITEDTDGDSYAAYRDAFPNEVTQWADADFDNLGDNPIGDNPDPSLNDIDNDGVADANDPDNIPENDLNPSNDSDHGDPSFVSTLADAHVSSNSELTTVSVPAPTVADVFDDYHGNDLSVSASVNGEPLTVDLSGNYEIDLEVGSHLIIWDVSDQAGNDTSTTQQVNVYPQISFSETTTTIGENQTAEIEIALSGPSPVYPFNVNVSVAPASAGNSDVDEDISTDLVVTFTRGQTVQTVTLSATSDNNTESSESMTLSLVDNFVADTWTLAATNTEHTLTIEDFNQAPAISFTLQQGGITVTEPDNISGIITLNATVTDGNEGDTHSYSWSLASLGLGNSLTEDVSFDPSDIQPNNYTVMLTVTDNGLPNQSTMEMFNFTIAYGDSDGDGYNDDVDAFPNDSREHLDDDGDGVGNNSDVFPDDPNEHADSDNDGTGDNADPFDNDPNETSDRDYDGVGDNSDLFPDNSSEQFDTDGDGVGDNSDAFPNDASEQLDSDGDGVGDNTDELPFNRQETKDSDGDGVGDNSDEFPNDASRSARDANDNSEEETTGGSLPLGLLILLLPLVAIRRVK